MSEEKRLDMYGGILGGAVPLAVLIIGLVWLCLAERGGTKPFWACAWLALAGLAAGETGGGRFTAGEVTIQEGDGAARAAALRLQAETVLGPWLADRGFAFQGVPG